MPVLNIKDAETYELASELARGQGETLTQAVKTALRERLERNRAAGSDHSRLVERVLELGRRASSRPILDSRSSDEIIGYDELGIPR